MSKREDDDDEELGILPNRIKELRKAQGITVEQLAERAGYSTGHVSNVENHKRGFTPKSLKKIAAALNVKPAELLDVSNAWQNVPLLGYIGDRGIFRPAGENGKQKSRQIRVPLALGDVIALKIEGNALYPRYDDGTIIICAKVAVSPKDGVGRECFVVMPDGISMLRRIERGSSDQLFNLMLHSQPPAINVEVMNCRPVLLALPPA